MARIEPSSDLLTIGELSRLTGISTHTLRMWEKRYGTPNAQRLPSGHRRYPREEVPRLRAIAKAVESGYRAGKVVCGTLEELQNLLGLNIPLASKDQKESDSQGDPLAEASRDTIVERWMEAVHQYDEECLEQGFHEEWGRHGSLKFVIDYAGPFMQRIGQGWVDGELTIAHEHFASERLSDYLSGKWRTLNTRKSGPTIVLSTLPGESHRLGLLMCAAVTSLTDYKIVYLGNNLPVGDILSTVKKCAAKILAVSVSSSMSRAESENLLTQIKQGMGKNVTLIAGGAGVPKTLTDIPTFNNFSEYYDWLNGQSSK